MGQYFELILLILTVASAAIALSDLIFFEKHRRAKMMKELGLDKITRKELKKAVKPPLVADYARSLFPVFFLVLFLRSFIAKPFVIPSGSMLPGLKIHDFIVVSKMSYGIRVPVWHKEIIKTGKPKRGDVVVFRFPLAPKINFIKRVIGVPGDHISYKDKQLFVNGKKIAHKKIDSEIIPQDSEYNAANVYQEKLGKHVYQVADEPWVPAVNFRDVVVPRGEYFVMGDNRDNSEDSRYWGFVPEQNFVGQAKFIWFSWDSNKFWVRWKRLFKAIK